ncbi:puromycin N-acetyltransferase [Podospora aff. communis PSN243]|uniref:Puromycin N-acetyltransferase n=1 Tax=Podospora aff. communis PSN243 TaxID=3040156 RepID=A0AAV9GRH6_9PEZI|nr:puromycin N-acetyltransferase [Podospora aff. communis PSN243]
MATPKPQLRIRAATQADATTLAEIHSAAFGPDIISQLLFPGGITEDGKAKTAYWMFPPPDPDPKAATPERLIMVAELVPEDGPADAPGEVVAFAKWTLRRKPIPEEQWNADPPIEAGMLGEGSNIEVYKWFNGTLHRRFREIAQGDPMLYLGVLVCLPHRQRLGAGSALLRWGTDLADSLGLISWLEASPYGYHLYKRHGYEDVAVIDFKVTETWGAKKAEGWNWGEKCALELGGPLPEGEMRTVIMKRVPNKAA